MQIENWHKSICANIVIYNPNLCIIVDELRIDVVVNLIVIRLLDHEINKNVTNNFNSLFSYELLTSTPISIIFAPIK